MGTAILFTSNLPALHFVHQESNWGAQTCEPRKTFSVFRRNTQQPAFLMVHRHPDGAMLGLCEFSPPHMAPHVSLFVCFLHCTHAHALYSTRINPTGRFPVSLHMGTFVKTLGPRDWTSAANLHMRGLSCQRPQHVHLCIVNLAFSLRIPLRLRQELANPTPVELK